MSGSLTTPSDQGASVTIRVRSHHFLIKDPSPRVRIVIREFIKPLIKWDTKWVRGRPVREISAIYACANAARTEYRFPINFLPKFVEALKRAEFTDEQIKQVNDRPGRGALTHQQFKEGFVVKDEQVNPLEYLKDFTDDRTKLLELQTGKGKAQPLGAAIKIPGGWSTMGEMEVGRIITDSAGNPASVLAVHPQGVRRVYEVVFQDGRSTRCDEDHLWHVGVEDSEEWRTVTTKEVLELMDGDREVFIPLAKPENWSNYEFDVTPHNLGRSIARADPVVRVGSIPEDYLLLGSVAQRLSLLNGIRGRKSKEALAGGKIVTLTEDLARNIQRIVWSLGYVAYVDPMQYGAFVVTIEVETELAIEQVRYVGEELTQCIEVSSDDKLYVTDDFIITHNTATTLKAIEEEGRCAIYFMPAKYVVNWSESVEKFHDPSVKNLFMDGSGDIKKLIKAKLAKKAPDYANYFISSNTFDRFIKMYEREPKRFRREYGIGIDQFFKLLGIDTVVVDEAHEFLHFNVKLWCYTNVFRTISLSGTYESKDRLEVLVMKTMHPMEQRREREAYDKYSDSYCWLYEVIDPENVQTTERGDEKYSHNAFERYFLKNTDRRERYFTLLHEMMRVEYFETRKPGQSMLLYCAAVDTCMWFSEWLKKRYPAEKITYFVSGSSFEEDFLNSDIVISTHGKSGTALDKPGLCTVIQTIPMDGNRGFKQAFGRIRKISDQRTRFAMLTASNLDKPMRYFGEKHELLEKMSLTVQRRVYPHRI